MLKKRNGLVLVLITAIFLLLASCGNNAKPKMSKASAEAKMSQKKAINELQKLEQKYQAKLGIYAINTADQNVFRYHSAERFAYTSTYKATAGGILLKNLSTAELNQKLNYQKSDLVSYSPITEKHVEDGMTVKALIQAAMAYSDNTAGNLLLKKLNGPKGFQKELNKIGDKVTQASRYETELNQTNPDDKRDTTTAEAMAKDLLFLTTKESLPAERANYFKQTLIGNTTGDKLIRVSVPKGYLVGDKTGAGSYGTRNDIAVIYPKGDTEKQLIWVIFSKKTTAKASYDDRLIADAAFVLSNFYEL